MRPTDTAVRWAGALSVALVLSACSTQPTSQEVEQRAREIQRWMGERNEGSAAGTLGAGTGLVSPSDEVPQDQAGRQRPGTSLIYETPVTLEGVVASCSERDGAYSAVALGTPPG
jgi:hypothetical protein